MEICNLKEICEYLRIGPGRFYLNLKEGGEYEDMPREKEVYKCTDIKGRKHAGIRYKFDIQQVYEYLRKKFNQEKKGL